MGSKAALDCDQFIGDTAREKGDGVRGGNMVVKAKLKEEVRGQRKVREEDRMNIIVGTALGEMAPGNYKDKSENGSRDKS